MTRIVINAALMRLRTQRTRHVVSLDDPLYDKGVAAARWVMDRGPSPEQHYARVELGKILARGVTFLNAEMRTALRLRYVEGFSIKEVAETSGSTIKSRLRRPRLQLASSTSLFKARPQIGTGEESSGDQAMATEVASCQEETERLMDVLFLIGKLIEYP
jgi:DNA-directed RNA polymerase specialized sigma24 family protein